jgi:hypothetical protein
LLRRQASRPCLGDLAVRAALELILGHLDLLAVPNLQGAKPVQPDAELLACPGLTLASFLPFTGGWVSAISMIFLACGYRHPRTAVVLDQHQKQTA